MLHLPCPGLPQPAFKTELPDNFPNGFFVHQEKKMADAAPEAQREVPASENQVQLAPSGEEVKDETHK